MDLLLISIIFDCIIYISLSLPLLRDESKDKLLRGIASEARVLTSRFITRKSLFNATEGREEGRINLHL